MIPEKVSQIRSVIAEQKSDRDNQAGFHFWLLEKTAHAHHLVELPESQTFEALAQFIEAYIDFLPECLEHFYRVAERANLNKYTDLFLNIATDFVLAPSEGAEFDIGYGRLVDKTYMAHRLLEELNDRCHRYLGGPGLPADTAMANVIVHSLLGEDFANELDIAVHFAIESQADKERQAMANIEPRSLDEITSAGREWPEFGQDLLVGLKFKF